MIDEYILNFFFIKYISNYIDVKYAYNFFTNIYFLVKFLVYKLLY